MPAKKILQFHEVDQPITEPVTKFGGQPVWIEEPEWPLSEETDDPMIFIGQIALDAELFPEAQGKMAYFFITDREEAGSVLPTWDPDAGENAIVIQPDGDNWMSTSETATGPTIDQTIKSSVPVVDRTLEYGVTYTDGYDEDFLPEYKLRELPSAERDKKFGAIEENKIGGTPRFIQGDAIPEEDWQLLFQLHSGELPFYVDFGDWGIGYAFISSEGSEGKFLWQCY